VLTAPEQVADADVREAVRAHWLDGAVAAVHLPVGFGAHHWEVADGAGRRLFVTLDALGERHSAESLEGAYAGAAALSRAGLRAVWPSLPARTGTFTVPFGGGAPQSGRLSATGWLEGRTPTEADAAAPRHVDEVLAVLASLHRCSPPPGIPEWAPRVAADFPRRLRQRTASPWTRGPFGEEARAAIVDRLPDVDRWTRRYFALAEEADRHRDDWVSTHGEPHFANQVVTPDGLRLVDWESLALAPRERDLVDAVDSGVATADSVGAREEMLELFRLDWRLSEIAEYTAWFSGPHGRSSDDRTALAGLHEELRGGGHSPS
jgi:spectinomycin phosphotransferase